MTYSKLIHYVDSFIREHRTSTNNGYKVDIDSVHQSDLEEFAAQLIDLDSKQNEGWEFLMDDIYREEIAANFAQSLMSYGDKKLSLNENLLSAMKQSAIKYYRIRMQELIDSRIEDVEHEDDWERCHPEEPAYQGAYL